MLMVSIFMLLLAGVSVLISVNTEEEIIRVAMAILAMLIYVGVLMLSPWPLKAGLILFPLTIAVSVTRSPRTRYN